LKEANTMQMKSPPHPGELTGDSLEGLGTFLCSGAAPIGLEELGSTADTRLRVQMNYDLALCAQGGIILKTRMANVEAGSPRALRKALEGF
jgi:hypothetical protein